MGSNRKRRSTSGKPDRGEPIGRGDEGNEDHSSDDHDGGGRRTVGRLRGYLHRDNGREFDPSDSSTSEGRLVDPESPSWYIPSGREPHLRVKSGRRAKDIQAGDVGRYRMSDFSMRVTNEHNHKASLRIELPDQMVNELTAIVDAKVFPSRNIQALARTLLYEGILLMHEIARQDGLFIPNSHVQHLESLAIINRDAGSVLQYDDTLEMMCDQARELARRGIRNKARTMIHEMLAVVKTIRSTELKDRWMRDIKAEFGQLLQGRPASVHPSRRAIDKVTIDEEYDD